MEMKRNLFLTVLKTVKSKIKTQEGSRQRQMFSASNMASPKEDCVMLTKQKVIHSWERSPHDLTPPKRPYIST